MGDTLPVVACIRFKDPLTLGLDSGFPCGGRGGPWGSVLC